MVVIATLFTFLGKTPLFIIAGIANQENCSDKERGDTNHNNDHNNDNGGGIGRFLGRWRTIHPFSACERWECWDPKFTFDFGMANWGFGEGGLEFPLLVIEILDGVEPTDNGIDLKGNRGSCAGGLECGKVGCCGSGHC